MKLAQSTQFVRLLKTNYSRNSGCMGLWLHAVIIRQLWRIEEEALKKKWQFCTINDSIWRSLAGRKKNPESFTAQYIKPKAPSMEATNEITCEKAVWDDEELFLPPICISLTIIVNSPIRLSLFSQCTRLA